VGCGAKERERERHSHTGPLYIPISTGIFYLPLLHNYIVDNMPGNICILNTHCLATISGKRRKHFYCSPDWNNNNNNNNNSNSVVVQKLCELSAEFGNLM
jgi:hypothetical protein